MSASDRGTTLRPAGPAAPSRDGPVGVRGTDAHADASAGTDRVDGVGSAGPDRFDGVGSAGTDRYGAVAELSERLVVAAGTGDLELLGRLVEDWDAVSAGLPAVPVPDAGPALTRAAAAHAQLGVLLRAARDRLGDELARGAAGRRTAVGYGAGVSARTAVGVVAEHRA